MDRSRIGVEPDRADRRGPVDRPSNVPPHRFFAAGLGFRARRTRSHSHRRAVPRIELPAPLTRWRPLALVWCRRRASRPVRSTVSARASRACLAPSPLRVVPGARRDAACSRRAFPRDVDVGRRRASARVGGATRARTRPARRERIRGRADASVAPPTIRGGVSASTRARLGPLFRTSPRRDRAANSPFYPLPVPHQVRAPVRAAFAVKADAVRASPTPVVSSRARDSRGRPNAPPTVSPRPRPSRAGTAASAFRTGETPRAATHRTARERPIFTKSKRSPRAPKQRRADDANVFSPRRPPSPPEPFRLPSRRRRFASG